MHRNKSTFRGLLSVIALGAFLCSALAPSFASAQYAGRPDNWRDRGMQQATAASTFATTAYADLPGTTLTFTPTRDPTQAEAPGGNLPPSDRMQVDWSLDVTKATATVITCAVFANGAIIAASAKSSTVTVEGVIGGTYEVPLTVSGSQVIKLQCKSGDTNTGTVNNGQVSYTEVY